MLGQRYRILDRLGEGGMANVYRALDEKLGRYVAVKILHDHLRRNPDIRSRFQQEALAVSTLDHPNIMRMYDFSGPELEQLWLVGELINGATLANMLQARPDRRLPQTTAACIVREISRALDHAHRSGIVHRDIKPENVMVTLDGRLKLMDFGIAKDTHNHRKTQTGMFMGSPSYMSPEQVKGRNVDARSDICSLGVLFYELLTGRLPYEGASSSDVIEKISKGEFVYPRFRTHGLSTEIDRMVVRCMQKNAEARFQSASDLGVEIDAWLSSHKVYSSALELESYVLRGATKPPESIASGSNSGSGFDGEISPVIPDAPQISRGRKTKIRTATPKLIRPVAPQKSRAKRRPSLRSQGFSTRGSQIPVVIAIFVAIAMAGLWLTEFRILRNFKSALVSKPSTPTSPATSTSTSTSTSQVRPTPTEVPLVPVVEVIPSISSIPFNSIKPEVSAPPAKPNKKGTRPSPSIKPRAPQPLPATPPTSPATTPATSPEATAIAIPSTGPSAVPSNFPSPGIARISIASQPAAEIFVNNKRIGTTIDRGSSSGWLVVNSGSNTLTLRRNGYRDYVRKISVAKDERLSLGNVTLERSAIKALANGDYQGGEVRTLTITTNRWPANVTITPAPDTNAKIQRLRLEQASKSVKLPLGRFTVRVESDGDFKERRIDTSTSASGITYSVEFPRSQGTNPELLKRGREP